MTKDDNKVTLIQKFIIKGDEIQEILEIAEKYGVSLSESDIALANERWDDGKKIIIIASGRLY